MSANSPNRDQQTISLLTTTTGLVDICFIAAKDEPTWALPQSLVLDEIHVAANIETLQWQDQVLPVHRLVDLQNPQAYAVVIEGEEDAQRFVLLTAQPSTTIRVRISSLRDTNDSQVLAYCYQKVMYEDQMYQIPDIDRLTQVLLSNS